MSIPPPENLDLSAAPTAVNALEFVNQAIKICAEKGGSTARLGVPVIVTLNLLHLVRRPELVKLYITQAVRFVSLEFELAEEDVGKVLGKAGHTIDALRSLARSIAGGSEREFQIGLIEDRRPPTKASGSAPP